MVIVGRIALPLGRGRNAGDGQFLWPRRPPINRRYRTLQTMVIVGRIALPLGAWTKAVGAGGTIGKANFRQLPAGRRNRADQPRRS